MKLRSKKIAFEVGIAIFPIWFFLLPLLSVLDKSNTLGTATDIYLWDLYRSMLLFELNCEYAEDVQLSRIQRFSSSELIQLDILVMQKFYLGCAVSIDSIKMENAKQYKLSRSRMWEAAEDICTEGVRVRERWPWFVISNTICYI